jgi:glucosamine-phosphate N-acetyltransferase
MPARANTGQGLRSNQIYFPIVIISRANDQLVGTGTVFMEKKFLRGLGTVGHIEDIAVDKSQQGKKLGLRIIQALTGISEALGAYKTILNCSDNNIRKPICSETEVLLAQHFCTAFYEKCGYTKKENEMVCLFLFVFVTITNLITLTQAKYAPGERSQTPVPPRL